MRTGRRFLEYELTNRRLVDVGDADVVPTNVAGTFESITRMTRQVVDHGTLPVILGGDHAITFPVVRGFSGPLHVLHFDAHTDYAPFANGLEMTNGHAFRHIHRMPHVETLTQIGIRGLRTSTHDSIADGNRVITMDEFRAYSPEALVEPLPRDARCYVSIDIDALDMSLVPGTVSAEPDGMSYTQLRDALVAVARRVDVVGFDLVEVNPALDVGTGITSYLAAYLIIEFLGHICDQSRWRERRR